MSTRRGDPYIWVDPWELAETANRRLAYAEDRLEEAQRLDDGVYSLLRNQAEAHYLRTRNIELERQAMAEAISRYVSVLSPPPIFVNKTDIKT